MKKSLLSCLLSVCLVATLTGCGSEGQLRFGTGNPTGNYYAYGTEIAQKAKDWLDNVGNTYLNDNDIIVSRVTAITNRDNILTIDYEYRNGFDCVFWLYDEINKSLITPPEQRIEKVKIGDKIIEKET